MVKSWKVGAITFLFIMFFSTAYGQFSVSLRFNRSRYMLYERIYACVTLRNDSGKPLLFGKRPELQGFILFDIRDSSNRLIQRRKGMEISVDGLYIAPGEIKNMVIPLNKYYDLDKEGVFHIHAYVSHNNIPYEYRSKDELIRISAGAVVWQKVVGLPSRTGDDDRHIERRYSVCKVEGDGTKYYYLRVEDDGKVYAVTRLGMVMSHMNFSAQVDMLSRIHLLMPVGPRVYHYMAFNADGMTLENSYWKTSGTVPMLYRNPKSGVVSRMGGVPARKGIDYDDPKQGALTISELLEESNSKPQPAADGGLVDLGKDLMPVKAADED
ncbi:MAG: hypothetical protein E7043_00180 [Lentisphaerae bacterium]|nr:hypothetical protein [Lentisphaerota bacterium]